jgi:hypothetical protein
MRKLTVSLLVAGLVFVTVGNVVSAECVVPTDGMILTSGVSLCPGEYYLPNGIAIAADGVLMQCNGTTLIGNGTNSGIFAKGYHFPTIVNCTVKNYRIGIEFRELSGAEIYKANVSDFVAVGLYLHNADSSVFSDINIQNGGDAIVLESSSDNNNLFGISIENVNTGVQIGLG